MAVVFLVLSSQLYVPLSIERNKWVDQGKELLELNEEERVYSDGQNGSCQPSVGNIEVRNRVRMIPIACAQQEYLQF